MRNVVSRPEQYMLCLEIFLLLPAIQSLANCKCQLAVDQTRSITCNENEIEWRNQGLVEQFCNPQKTDREFFFAQSNDYEIDFSANHFRSLITKLDEFDPPAELFAGIRIKSLDLSNCELKSMSPEKLDRVLGIESIILDWNSFSSLDWLNRTDNFKEVTKLSVVENKLTTIRGNCVLKLNFSFI